MRIAQSVLRWLSDGPRSGSGGQSPYPVTTRKICRGRSTGARAAMDAGRRLAATGACLYDDLGVVRLLVGGQDDPDLRKFVSAITQPLLDYDASHDGALLTTLRAFSRCSCSRLPPR